MCCPAGLGGHAQAPIGQQENAAAGYEYTCPGKLTKWRTESWPFSQVAWPMDHTKWKGRGGASWNVPLASPALSLCVCGSPSPQKRTGARPSQALHVERRVPADRQSPQARSAQGAVVHKVLPQFIPYVQWAGRGKSRGVSATEKRALFIST